MGRDAMREKTGPLPMSGLMVLDFTTLLPGPLATLTMLEAGAEVIKVEPLQGDPMRHVPPLWGRDSALFAMLNRGKKSIRLDLEDTRQLEHLLPLIRRADVLVEQFRPGVMDRLGLGYQSLHTLNPRLVHCSITGYGSSGPRAGTPGHDLTFQAVTGLLSLSCGTPSRPVMPDFFAAGLAGGTWPALTNILLALLQRERTGEGMHLEVSMSSALFMFQSWAIAQGLVEDDWPRSGQGAYTGANPRYRLYGTQDGRLVAVAALEDKYWNILCDALDLPPEERDSKANPIATRKSLTKIFAARKAAHWRKVFAENPCCCAVVATLEEAMRDMHFHETGVFDHVLENETGDTLPANPLALDPALRVHPQKAATSAPALGAHNDMLLK